MKTIEISERALCRLISEQVHDGVKVIGKQDGVIMFVNPTGSKRWYLNERGRITEKIVQEDEL